MKYLLRRKPKILIIDECHLIKSRRAARTKAVKKLSQKIPYIIAIGATPLLNRPAEMFPTLNILRPDLYPSFFAFAAKYCDLKRNAYGWDYSGAKNLDKLHKRLCKTLMIRRLRSVVWKHPVKKIRKVIPLPIIRPKEYHEAVHNFLDWLRKISTLRATRAAKAKQLTQIGYLVRLAAKLKMRYVIKRLNKRLRRNKGKIVIYATHTNIIRQLHNKYKDISVVIDGGTSDHNRRLALKSFRLNKKIRMFIGNIRAAGIGIDLAMANTLVFVEMGWTPGEHAQAEDRIISKAKRGKVHIHYYVAQGTIEEHLCEVIQRKQRVISRTLDGSIQINKLDIFKKLITILRKGSPNAHSTSPNK